MEMVTGLFLLLSDEDMMVKMKGLFVGGWVLLVCLVGSWFWLRNREDNF